MVKDALEFVNARTVDNALLLMEPVSAVLDTMEKTAVILAVQVAMEKIVHNSAIAKMAPHVPQKQDNVNV